MRRCSKCEGETRLEEHHFYPKVHYGNGHRNPHTITLCHECHIKIETIILSVESFIGYLKFGQRYKMDKESYNRIHRNWLKESKLLYLQFS